MGAASDMSQRAQQGGTLAVTVAAATVAGGALGLFSARPAWVQLLGLVTLGSWVLTTWLYVLAIVGLAGVTTTTLADLQPLQRRLLLRPLRATAIALVLTTVAIASSLVTRTQTKAGSVILSPSAQRDLTKLCGKPLAQPLSAEIAVAAANQRFLELRLPEGRCVGGDEIRIPSSQVLAIRTGS
jgi:hypothetical protein